MTQPAQSATTAQAGAIPDRGIPLVVEEVFVTRAMAQNALDGMRYTRKLKWDKIAEYADDMSHGRWRRNGETIKLEDGHMVDGQNRMMAILRSTAQGVWMLIVNNIEAGSVTTVNLGANRSLADILSVGAMQGKLASEVNPRELPSYSAIQAVTSRIFAWDQGQYAQKRIGKGVSKLRLEEYHKIHHAEIDLAARKRPNAEISAIRVLTSVNGWSVTELILRRIDFNEADEFLGHLLASTGPPLMTLLRNRLISNRLAAARSRVKDADRWPEAELARALICRAWNAHIAGDDIGKLQLPKGHNLQDRFPVPQARRQRGLPASLLPFAQSEAREEEEKTEAHG